MRIICKYLCLILFCTVLAACAGKNPVDVRQDAYQAYQDGDYPLAVEKFKLLVEESPRDAELWFRLGNSYARSLRPQEAISAYQNALLRDPGLSKAWYNMGLIQMQSALKAFVDMQKYVEKDDPVGKRGRILRDELLDLLGENENNHAEQE